MTPANDRRHAEGLRRLTRHIAGPVAATVEHVAMSTSDPDTHVKLVVVLTTLQSVCRDLEAAADTLTGTPE